MTAVATATSRTAAAGFREAFEAEPRGVWTAPGRVNLIGEHTDYNGGFVLPFAIDRRTAVAVGLREDRVLRAATSFSDEVVEIAIDDLSPERLSGWSAYVLGIAWALGQSTFRDAEGADLSAVPGLDLYVASDVPVGAGLSSSAALECAVAVALDELWGLGRDRRSLAAVGQLAENKAVGAPTGIMDQSASLLGERDHAVLLDCRDLTSRSVALRFEEAGLEVLVIDTRVEHAHADGGYASRRASCELGARLLGVELLRDVSVEDLPRAQRLLDDETFRRVRHVVTEDGRVLETETVLATAGPTGIGPLLDASHASMRDDFEISCAELDLAVETARAAGALGARMTGGGFGGAAIALVRRQDVDAVASAVVDAFAEAGFREPATFTVRAADGAGRES